MSKELAELFVGAAEQKRPEVLSADTRRSLQLARALVRRGKKAARAPQQLSLALEGTT